MLDKNINIRFLSSADYFYKDLVNETIKNKLLYIDSREIINFKAIGYIINLLLEGEKILIVLNSYNDFIKIIEYLGFKDLEPKLDFYKKQYEKIYIQINKVEYINNDRVIKKYISRINLLSRKIDKNLRILEKTINIFDTKRSDGLTLLEMYAKTCKSVGKYEKRDIYFESYDVTEWLFKYTYRDLCNLISQLNDDILIKKYIYFKRFENNGKIKKVEDGLSEKKIIDSISRINMLLDFPENIILPKCKSNYLDEVINIYLEKYEFEGIERKIIESIKASKSIIKDKKCNKVMKFLSLIKNVMFNRNNSSNIKEENDESFLLNQEVSENIEALKTYLDSFKFLSDVLIDEEYKQLIESILKEERKIMYLDELKKILLCYKEFILNKNYLNSFPNEYIDLLNRCYETTKNHEDIKCFMNFLPQLYLLNEIEKIEEEEKESLEYYYDFEFILTEMKRDIKTFKELTINLLNLEKDVHENRFVTEDIIGDDSACKFNNSEKYQAKISNQSFDKVIVYPKNSNSTNTLTNRNTNIDLLNNYIKKSLVKYIEKLGYYVKQDIRIKGMYIPIVVHKKIDLEPVLLIRLDFCYVINDAIWKINNNEIETKMIIIWTRDWWKNRNKEINKLKEMLR